LECLPYKTNYSGDQQTASHWRLFSNNETIFPIYDVIDEDSYFFGRKDVIMPLVKGEYFWQVRFRNSFGIWSEWVTDSCFIDSSEISINNIEDAYFSLNNDTISKISTMHPDTWYYLTIALGKNYNRENLGFIVAWLNDSSYTFGNINNRGGKFIPASSYIVNISLSDSNLTAFEKSTEGRSTSTPLTPGKQGKYVDASHGAITFNTATGLVSIRTKILPQANCGIWQLSAAVTNSYMQNFKGIDKFSYLFRRRISVRAINSPESSFLLTTFVVPFLLALTIGLCAFILIKKRKKHSDFSNDPQHLKGLQNDFNKILELINGNLYEDITSATIKKNLRLSQVRFYEILRINGTSIPKLLNKYRIDKAKTLLAETDKQISEIGYDVGFKESQTFFKVFKTLENTTPGTFRRVVRINRS